MTLTAEERKLLRSGLLQLELPAGPQQLDWYQRYMRELELWSRRVRLISGSHRDIIVRHILDSLAPWQIVRRELGLLSQQLLDSRGQLSVADVGSGNGFPALVLAGLSEAGVLPAAKYYLVERGAKKAAFLRSTAGLLGLFKAVRVEEVDVRQVERQVQLVVSRAFMPLSEGYPLLEPLIGAEGGEIIFYAGRKDTIDAELCRFPQLPELEISIEPVVVPFLDEERHVCRFYRPFR